MTLRDALDRTLLLMRDEVSDNVSDDDMVTALSGTRVALMADGTNIASHSAQTAFVTAAMLMARSGHEVFLLCPPVRLAGPQPPIENGDLVQELERAGRDLLPGCTFRTEMPKGEPDLAIAFGNSEFRVLGARCLRLNATPWAGRLDGADATEIWSGGPWPLGAMAAACLAAAEAFKVALKKLTHAARNPARIRTVFAPVAGVTFALAPEWTPFSRDLGAFDCVSGGAIVNAILYALARVPGVDGRARVIEPDIADLSNLNRYMLLRRSHLNEPKAHDLQTVLAGTGLSIEPVFERYDRRQLPSLLPLAPSVLVGVDDIPTRWLVQRACPQWLGVGATTHWSALASFHADGLGCAECLHPTDDPGNERIPTVSFVSFWAGLLTASYFLRHRAAQKIPVGEQQIYLTALRPEHPSWSPVPLRPGCPSCTSLDKPSHDHRV